MRSSLSRCGSRLAGSSVTGPAMSASSGYRSWTAVTLLAARHPWQRIVQVGVMVDSRWSTSAVRPIVDQSFMVGCNVNTCKGAKDLADVKTVCDASLRRVILSTNAIGEPRRQVPTRGQGLRHLPNEQAAQVSLPRDPLSGPDRARQKALGGALAASTTPSPSCLEVDD